MVNVAVLGDWARLFCKKEIRVDANLVEMKERFGWILREAAEVATEIDVATGGWLGAA